MTVTSLVASQFPSRAQCNPYIGLLKSSLAQSRVRTHEHDLFVDGVGLPYPTADPEWLRRHQGRVNVLHFHWLQKFYRASSAAESQRRMAQFADFLELARRLDYRIAYTFHNVFPHEGMGAELDVAMRRLIIQHADVMTCFSERQKAHLREAFGPIRLTVIPHANYAGCYADDLSPAECRRRLDLPPEARVFSYIGLVRGYKELPYLIDTFADLDLPDAALLLAGTALDEALGREIEAMAADKPNVRAHLRWIADDEIQLFMKACDAVVLPYQRCWTSGAIMLAFSFGKPVVTADPMMLDDTQGLGFFYPSQEGLGAALLEAAGAQDGDLKEMGRKCLGLALRRPWRAAGRQLAAAYSAACRKQAPRAARPVTAAGGSP